MKKLIVICLVLVFFSMLFTSCKKEEMSKLPEPVHIQTTSEYLSETPYINDSTELIMSIGEKGFGTIERKIDLYSNGEPIGYASVEKGYIEEVGQDSYHIQWTSGQNTDTEENWDIDKNTKGFLLKKKDINNKIINILEFKKPQRGYKKL